MSITLAASEILSTVLGGVTVETNTQGGALDVRIDFNTPTVYVTFVKGAVSGNNIIAGANSKYSLSIQIDGSNGTWISSNGQTGTLSPTALTNLLTYVKNLRNAVETFTINNGLIAGTQVAWT